MKDKKGAPSEQPFGGTEHRKPGSLWPSLASPSSSLDHMMQGQHRGNFKLILWVVVADLVLLAAFATWYFFG